MRRGCKSFRQALFSKPAKCSEISFFFLLFLPDMGADVVDDLNGVGVLPPLHLSRITLNQLCGPTMSQPLFRIRFDSTLLDPETVLWIRIRRTLMFLDLLDPDPSLFVWIRILRSSRKNCKKTLISAVL